MFFVRLVRDPFNEFRVGAAFSQSHSKNKRQSNQATVEYATANTYFGEAAANDGQLSIWKITKSSIER